MHSDEWQTGKRFFLTYVANIQKPLTVVEIGSIIGCLRTNRTSNIIDYIGVNSTLDAESDIVLHPDHPYYYQLWNDTVDVVVSSSYFENSRSVGLSFMEAMRILKPDGILFCNIPADQFIPNNNEQYPTTPQLLEQWANVSNIPVKLLESKILPNNKGYFAIFIKNKAYDYCYRMRIFDN